LRRLNLFLKGNLDLRDSLHSLRLNGDLVWNGVNEILRGRFPGTTIRLRHETWTRSDALLESEGQPPGELGQRNLPLGPHAATSQFSVALFEQKADAIVLSVQPDVMVGLLRHRREGYLFYPNNLAQWSPFDREWLRATFEPVPRLDVERSMANFRKIVERCRANTDAPILIYNISSILPAEWIHCYAGMDDILSTRIKHFNLGLVELSQKTGISIVDVDRVVARKGADALKLDGLHLNSAGCRLVAEEVVNILDDIGCFPAVR
jgi:hypothetical protein